MDNIDLYEMTQEEIDAFINYQDKPRLNNMFIHYINVYKYKYTIIINVYIAIALYLYFTEYKK
jgi:hypothetical protein